MILHLAPPSAVQQDGTCGALGDATQRFTTDPNEVVAWLEKESFERIVVRWPCEGFNPFCLGRQLQERKPPGPALIVAGRMRPATQFWAERNACRVAESEQAACQMEVDVP